MKNLMQKPAQSMSEQKNYVSQFSLHVVGMYHNILPPPGTLHAIIAMRRVASIVRTPGIKMLLPAVAFVLRRHCRANALNYQ